MSCGDQPGHPDQIVGDQVEQEVSGDATDAAMFRFPHRTALFAPAEDALGHRPARLRHDVAVVSVVRSSMAPRRHLPALLMPLFCVTCGVTLRPL